MGPYTNLCTFTFTSEPTSEPRLVFEARLLFKDWLLLVQSSQTPGLYIWGPVCIQGQACIQGFTVNLPLLALTGFAEIPQAWGNHACPVPSLHLSLMNINKLNLFLHYITAIIMNKVCNTVHKIFETTLISVALNSGGLWPSVVTYCFVWQSESDIMT